MFSRILLPSAALLWAAASTFCAEPMPPVPPKTLDPELRVELVAQEPQIRTPTAVQVDAQGRIWALENNTHFRPKDYVGAPTDRVLIFDQFSTDGRAGRVTVFAEGFRDGMGLRLLPDGDAVVTTRAEIFRLHDRAGSGHGDEKTTLLKMETADNYPHNGLSGTAISPDGMLYVGLGENHGSPWKITGSDGTTVSGSDEGGVFRCDLEGRKLERWALGFWNPFGLAFDQAGRLFALDNDPGAGSLCRLLHVVRHGDYGFRYRYGRTADHPFLSWFGQLRGDLGPLCLVGEAPTGLLHYQGGNLGAAYTGDLLGCTWDDHGVQRFHLEPKGASFATQPEWLVRGGYYFRPTGIAQAPDGSLVVGDWVDGSYEVHGKGRLWRIRRTDGAVARAVPAPAAPPAEQTLRALLDGKASPDDAIGLLASDDPYLVHGAIDRLAHGPDTAALQAHAADADPKVRLGVLLAWRRGGRPEGREGLARWLSDADGAVRRAALQWIAEERLADWKEKAAASLDGQPSSLTFQSYLAALQLVESGKPDPKVSATQTVRVALDPARPAELRALALRLVPVDHDELPIAKLEALLHEADAGIRLGAIRILAARSTVEVQPVLRRVAADGGADVELRAEALSALGASAGTPESHAVLREALASPEPKLRREALRSLRTVFDVTDAKQAGVWIGTLNASRPVEAELLAQLARLPLLTGARETESWATLLAALASTRPAPGEAWPQLFTEAGDAAAGRRLFYHANGPRCFTCHTIEGRGGAVGPDLTPSGRMTPEQLLVAIREPSKEIAPAFLQWALTLRDGQIAVGIDLFEDNKAQTVLIDATGKKTRYQNENIVSREALPVSLMPPGLDALMTDQELRDLLAYLRAPRD